ncbi:MAG TPA: GntR family transcriptional regulator [Gaiellaceae bacterium]|jgi:DNA-binding GntR family transcriptional regulator|nr:GntR family transcriptional regulator [Gaiellaceae bacterium]
MNEALERVVRIERSSVEAQVAQALRELIVRGELPEGTPLVQRDLAGRLGVSQTPIRLGLLELERAGLVEVGDTGRALVRRLTREDFEETYVARLALEGLAARVGAPAVGPGELGRMRELHRELERLGAKQAVDDYLRRRWEFHAVCYAASGRPRLVAEIERLFWRGERYNRLVLSGRERFTRSLAHYRDFLEACEARNGAEAERVIHESVRWALDAVLDSLPSEVAAGSDGS